MQPAAPRPVVLVVDNDDAIHDALWLILDDDYEVISAFGGDAALRELEQRHVDIVLLDLVMPKVDGWEVFERLLRMNGRRPKVVFLTGVDYSAAAVAAVRLGAEDWIVKPFEDTVLLMRLRSLLQTRRILIESGELGARGTIAVLASRRCGLPAGYLRDGSPPSGASGVAIVDAAAAGSETGLASLLSRPPLGLTALAGSTIAALHHVSRHYSEVNVGSLAQAVGLTADSLLKLFKRDLSLTPGEYIARVRVEVIKQRLARPGRPSFERLAEEVGLCDAAHLSRTFTRYQGQPPGLYGGNIQGEGGSIH